MVVRVACGSASFAGVLLLAVGCSSADTDAPSQTARSGAPATGGRSPGNGGSNPVGGETAGGAIASGGRPSQTGGTSPGGGDAGGVHVGGANHTTGGTTERGGSGGSNGSAEHCAPGEPIQTFPFDVVQPCYGDVFRHHLPNAAEVQLEDFRLETPAAAGERFAVSVRHQGKGPFDVEIWGAHEECGVAEELLWWGPMVEGVQCGEFVPSETYSHLLYVYRKRRNESYSFSSPELGLCNGGHCPAGAEGQGREPGVTPSGAPLVVRATPLNTHRRAFDLELGIYGRMVLLHDDAKQPKGTANPVHAGFFRMPPDDRFGDAWYCVGEGSSIAQSAENDTFEISLQNITRLPNCSPGAGTLSIRSGLEGVELSSSFGELGSPNQYAVEQSCIGTFCTFLFQDGETTESKHWLYLTPAESVGDYFMPTATPTAVAGATLFYQATQASAVSVTCAESGSITYDPMAETRIELDAMSDSFACPGEPLADDVLEFTTIEP